MSEKAILFLSPLSSFTFIYFLFPLSVDSERQWTEWTTRTENTFYFITLSLCIAPSIFLCNKAKTPIKPYQLDFCLRNSVCVCVCVGACMSCLENKRNNTMAVGGLPFTGNAPPLEKKKENEDGKKE